MNPMSMTYHEHVMANLRREAATKRQVRSIARMREHPGRHEAPSRAAVRLTAPTT